MQHIDIELDEFEQFYCPVTGQKIFSFGDGIKPSPATAFVYLEGMGMEGFEFLAEKYQKIELDDLDDEDTDVFEEFLKIVKDEYDLIVFSVTTSGMACGPVSSTLRIGVNMEHQEQLVQED